MFSYSFEEDSIAMTNTFIETLLPLYYDNNGDICDDSTKLKEIILVPRLIYSMLNNANHVKVEAHMAPLLPLTTLSISRPIPNLCNTKLSNAMAYIVRFVHIRN